MAHSIWRKMGAVASSTHTLPLESLCWYQSQTGESPGEIFILESKRLHQTIDYSTLSHDFSIIMYYNQNVYLNKEKHNSHMWNVFWFSKKLRLPQSPCISSHSYYFKANIFKRSLSVFIFSHFDVLNHI